MNGRRQTSRIGSLHRRASWPLVVVGVGVALWAVSLFHWLHPRHVTAYWQVTWGGFDLLLGVALAATGLAALRRSPWVRAAAGVTVGLLVADAWFDVTTATGARAMLIAGLEAVLVQLPVATLCLYAAQARDRRAEPAPEA